MKSEVKMLPMSDGTSLYLQIEERGHAQWIVVIHGIGEHCGRHKHYTELLGQYFNILYYDLRGHGQSQGERGAIKDFKQFSLDLKELLDFLRTDLRMTKYHLASHSMGALIACDFLQNIVSEDNYPEQVFLSSPPIGVGGHLGPLTNLIPTSWAQKLSALPVGVNLGGLVDLKYLSHNPEISENYIHDPLNILKLHTSLLLGLMYTSKRVFEKKINLKCPTAIIFGSGDGITSPEQTERYFTLVEKGHALKIIVDGRHELHNELEKFRGPYREFLKTFFLKSMR